MSDNTLVNDQATDAAANTENQAQATKTYTQEEFDNHMARMKASLEKKLLKPYAELGDPEQLRQIKSDWEQKQQETQLKRGEFEKTLQDIVAKKDAEIQKRDSLIKEYRVNTPLLSAAAQYKAVNAEQVKSLLVNQVRMNAEGEVEVIDSKGAIRYRDDGVLLGVEDLVREFLDSNPHFVAATPATVNTKSSHATAAANQIDLAKLDMKNPEHRRLYSEATKKKPR